MSLKEFVVMEKIGQGSFAKVYKVRRLTDHRIYALKQIQMNKLDQKSKQNALNEIRFLASFDCKSIIKYYEAFFEEKEALLCIVMEFADDGDLTHLIEDKKNKNQRIFEVQIWKVMIGLVHGLGYLHDRSVLHRDIKPDNIFITEGKYKIGDLNVSRVQSNDKQKLTQIGTPFYASPQIWENCPYDNKCDVWSLGCVLYQMATLNLPFSSKSMDKLYAEITLGKVRPIPKHYSNELGSIIYSCLEKEASKRPTIKQLLDNKTVKMYENLFYSSTDLVSLENKPASLLKTIIFPKDQKSLKNIDLPTSNYEQTYLNNEKQPSQIAIIEDKETEHFDKAKNAQKKAQKQIDIHLQASLEEKMKSFTKKQSSKMQLNSEVPKKGFEEVSKEKKIQNSDEIRQSIILKDQTNTNQAKSVKQLNEIPKQPQNNQTPQLSLLKQNQQPHTPEKHLGRKKESRGCTLSQKRKSIPRTELSAKKLTVLGESSSSKQVNRRRASESEIPLYDCQNHEPQSYKSQNNCKKLILSKLPVPECLDKNNIGKYLIKQMLAQQQQIVITKHKQGIGAELKGVRKVEGNWKGRQKIFGSYHAQTQISNASLMKRMRSIQSAIGL